MDRPRITLSVLDLVPVRRDQSTADAVAAAVSLAQTADRLGFERFWVPEHHNGATASTSAPVLVSILAGATARIRVGAGGVMLPNHAPLIIAEQFALLEAAFPGRIDLGVGRASGTDQITTAMLRRTAAGVSEDSVVRYPDDVDTLLALLDPDGQPVAVQGRTAKLRAAWAPVSMPTLWTLGSSTFTSRMAAEKGLPYVMGAHFPMKEDPVTALAIYRDNFRPSAMLAEPRALVSINAVVADTVAEAHRVAAPCLLHLHHLASGRPPAAMQLIEDAEGVRDRLDDEQRARFDGPTSEWIIGGPEEAHAQVAVIADTFDVDEILLVPLAGAYAGTDPRRNPTRERTLELLASTPPDGISGR